MQIHLPDVLEIPFFPKNDGCDTGKNQRGQKRQPKTMGA